MIRHDPVWEAGLQSHVSSSSSSSSSLSLSSAAEASSSYFHLRALRHISSMLTDDMAKSVAVPLVSSRLEYANSVLLALLLLILIKFNEFIILLPK